RLAARLVRPGDRRRALFWPWGAAPAPGRALAQVAGGCGRARPAPALPAAQRDRRGPARRGDRLRDLLTARHGNPRRAPRGHRRARRRPPAGRPRPAERGAGPGLPGSRRPVRAVLAAPARHRRHLSRPAAACWPGGATPLEPPDGLRPRSFRHGALAALARASPGGFGPYPVSARPLGRPRRAVPMSARWPCAYPLPYPLPL